MNEEPIKEQEETKETPEDLSQPVGTPKSPVFRKNPLRVPEGSNI